MSIVSDALAVLDDARLKLDEAGLCPYRVFVRVRTWSGQRVGDFVTTGAPVPPRYVDVTTELTVSGGGRPQVQLKDEKNVVAPGTPLQKATLEVGPLTPEYTGGGVATATLSPPGGKATESHFIVFGPDLPATGLLCKKTKLDASSPFRIMLTLESLGIAA